MRNIKIAMGIATLFIAVLIGVGLFSDMRIESVKNCKVINLQQQQIIKGTSSNVSTEIRYLVVTDKETFVCESSFINGKFDNSNIFWSLKKDSTYTFKVCGMGKGFIFDYRNILSYSKN